LKKKKDELEHLKKVYDLELERENKKIKFMEVMNDLEIELKQRENRKMKSMEVMNELDIELKRGEVHLQKIAIEQKTLELALLQKETEKRH